MVLSVEGPPPAGSGDSTDEELVKHWLDDGDMSAMEALYRHYYPQIYRFVAFLVGIDQAEDVASDTFCKVLESLDQHKRERSFRSWIFTIARNICKDRFRRARIIRSRIIRLGSLKYDPEEEPEDAESNGGIEEEVLQKDWLIQILQHVSVAHRACIYLDIIEEMPQKEIAHILHVSERSVRHHISKGKEELRIYLLVEKMENKQ